MKLVFANWGSTEEATKTMIDRVIRDYERQHPDVDVVNLPIPFNHYEQELLVMAMDGKLPDVMYLSGNQPALLGSLGYLEPLGGHEGVTDYIDPRYELSVRGAIMYRNDIVAVPLALTPHGLWYNKKLMAKAGIDPASPPKTMEELNVHLDIISERLPEVYGIGLDTTKINYAFIQNYPFFLSFGAQALLRNPTNPAFDSPESIRTLEWLQSAVQKGYTPSNVNIKIQREMMAYDRIVYKLDGPYFAGIIQNANPALTDEVFDATFGVTTVPASEGYVSATHNDYHVLSMSKQTEHKQLAWDFIRYLTDSEASVTEYIIPLGMIPSKTETQTRFSSMLSRPFYKAFIEEIVPSAVSLPFGPDMSNQAQYILSGLQEIIRGESVQEVAAAVNEILVEQAK
jgi:multiple sugar transport system substrate-binding protein